MFDRVTGKKRWKFQFANPLRQFRNRQDVTLFLLCLTLYFSSRMPLNYILCAAVVVVVVVSSLVLALKVWHVTFCVLQEETRWFNKNGPGICPLDVGEKKNTSLAKPLRVSSQCIPLFLEFSGTVFSLDRHIFPATSLSLLQHMYCSCTWMNVLQGADIAYGLYCVSRHISQCGPGCVWEQLPHCSLTVPSLQDTAVSSSVCCCCCVVVFLLLFFC